MSADALGWLAAGLLLVTMARQVFTQWRDRTAAGVSHWFFIGQVAASACFTAYSIMKGDTVFIVTNLLMLANAILGFAIDRRNRTHPAGNRRELETA